MAYDYRPRIVRQPQDGSAYLMTCKKESAVDLVRWLNENGVGASLSGTDTEEQMETPEGEEAYTVSEIEIEPPAEYEKVKTAVDAWRTRRK